MARTKQPVTARGADASWGLLYRIGGTAAVLSVLLIPIQIAIFIAWPPPEAIADWFALFRSSWLLGLLSFDLLYLLNNALLILIYLALYTALARANQSLMTIALVLGLVGIAAYYASNVAFEMLDLSGQYAAATTETERAAVLAAGRALLAVYTGTAFDVYYVFNAIALLIVAAVMLRSRVFSRATAYSGLVAGILMAAPSSAGTIGMVFALASLAPWIVFCILVARRLLQLGPGA